jgi:cyclophilin family peptidyl-prolyl cis-trans isomerase
MDTNAPPRSVVLETTTGPIGIELYWDHAPKTCKNFYELVSRFCNPLKVRVSLSMKHQRPLDIYSTFDRILNQEENGRQKKATTMVSFSTESLLYVSAHELWKLHHLNEKQDFMIQGGDPTGSGRGGTSIYGYAFC